VIVALRSSAGAHGCPQRESATAFEQSPPPAKRTVSALPLTGVDTLKGDLRDAVGRRSLRSEASDETATFPDFGRLAVEKFARRPNRLYIIDGVKSLCGKENVLVVVEKIHPIFIHDGASDLE
jgi:hypothetical protein